MRYLFEAESPRTGEIRRYEALLELGSTGPYAIHSDNEGETERYTPKHPDPPPIWLTPHKRVLILSEEVFDEQFKTPVHGGV
jgi:hypothetical protein